MSQINIKLYKFIFLSVLSAMFLFIAFTFFYLKTETGSRLFTLFTFKIYYEDYYLFYIMMFVAFTNILCVSACPKDILFKLFIILNPTIIFLLQYIDKSSVGFDYMIGIGLILLILSYINLMVTNKPSIFFITAIALLLISLIFIIWNIIIFLSFIVWMYRILFLLFIYSQFSQEIDFYIWNLKTLRSSKD